MPNSNEENGSFQRPQKNRKIPRLRGLDTSKSIDVFMKNSNNVNSINYLETFVANKLVLPPNDRIYTFKHADLQSGEYLGSGSFGNVKKMIHIPTNHEMAVKKIVVNHEADNKLNKSLESFQREIIALKGNACDEIVKFYGITFHERYAYMCMELMDLSLDKLYKISHSLFKKSFHEKTLNAVAVATIHALGHLKKNEIIHRDVKPSNILLNRNGQVKLCDFGICGYLQNSIAQSTEAGCRPYMAPERISPLTKEYDIKSDVWSLGISMIEVINGKYPYLGFSSVPIFEQVCMVVLGDPPEIEKEMDVSPNLRLFISNCLVKEPSKRADLDCLKNLDFYTSFDVQLHREEVGNFVAKMYELRHDLVEN